MTMIEREVKRSKLMKNCEHDFTDQPFRDPVDRRYWLRPTPIQFGDTVYRSVRCRKCGATELRECIQ